MLAVAVQPASLCLASITGVVAAETAGPAVILSYVVAGISAMLSSLCYAEFAVSMPFSGGAYSYISAVFGELFAW